MPAYRHLRRATPFALLALVLLACAWLLLSCTKVEQSSYREVSAVGFGAAPPDDKLLYQKSSGGIPPLTWFDGAVTSISCDSRAFDPVAGQTSTLSVNLNQAANILRVSVLDSLNGTVRVLYNQLAPAGTSTFVWNGKNSLNQNARYSIYVFNVVALNKRGQEIGRGQTEVITYRPKAGVSLQNADKYNNAAGEFISSSDEWVAAGLTNPGDMVTVFFDSMPRALANSETNGIFRSLPITYTPGAHAVKVRVYPRQTETFYDIDYSVYLNRIHCAGLSVLLNGNPVQHDFSYFVPGIGETVQVNYTLDAAEDGVVMYASFVPESGSDPVLRRTVDLGAKAAGQHSVAWDGKNDQGALLVPGKYCISIITKVDPAAAQFRPSVIFITKYINLQEVGQ